jgi:hypothetical protein
MASARIGQSPSGLQEDAVAEAARQDSTVMKSHEHRHVSSARTRSVLAHALAAFTHPPASARRAPHLLLLKLPLSRPPGCQPVLAEMPDASWATSDGRRDVPAARRCGGRPGSSR